MLGIKLNSNEEKHTWEATERVWRVIVISPQIGLRRNITYFGRNHNDLGVTAIIVSSHIYHGAIPTAIAQHSLKWS